MKRYGILFIVGLLVLAVPVLASGQQTEQKKVQSEKSAHEISQEELAASVPALGKLHEVVFPLWHNAYPQKDYALIKELLPRADTLTAALDAAALPGILRDK